MSINLNIAIHAAKVAVNEASRNLRKVENNKDEHGEYVSVHEYRVAVTNLRRAKMEYNRIEDAMLEVAFA